MKLTFSLIRKKGAGRALSAGHEKNENGYLWYSDGNSITPQKPKQNITGHGFVQLKLWKSSTMLFDRSKISKASTSIAHKPVQGYHQWFIRQKLWKGVCQEEDQDQDRRGKRDAFLSRRNCEKSIFCLLLFLHRLHLRLTLKETM